MLILFIIHHILYFFLSLSLVSLKESGQGIEFLKRLQESDIHAEEQDGFNQEVL